MAALFLAPWAIGFLVFTLGPLIASGYLSLTDYGLLSAPEFVGLSNYAKMLTDDPRFVKSIGVTALYVFVSVPVTLVAAFLVAALVNDRQRSSGASGKASRSPLFGFYRAAFYLPSLIAASVAVAILWVRLFAYDGIVNNLLAPLGLPRIAWIGQPGTAIWTIILLSVWSFGSTMVIFYAALKQVPAERYEAASIDGAGMLAKLWHITLPAISPIILFNAVIVLVNALQSFTPAYIVSNGTGGPADSTLVFALYLYEQAFRDLHMGYASAMAVLMLLALAGITALIFASSKFWVHYED
ncbi:ABC transporter permease [Acrocarpospora pleiomorpha]|uniref:ABC transporter permease n=1 Tax=Acrocarpospora pleiomorpha TaxID=90975 RepID=A0A5M3XF18_9ACTN|nr:sugar ABC transporter permease [Acrocarpospora pleiomorpha]GES18729.1 ABC transporter permease [Acrocarpospora pleiomorpha]